MHLELTAVYQFTFDGVFIFILAFLVQVLISCNHEYWYVKRPSNNKETSNFITCDLIQTFIELWNVFSYY